MAITVVGARLLLRCLFEQTGFSGSWSASDQVLLFRFPWFPYLGLVSNKEKRGLVLYTSCHGFLALTCATQAWEKKGRYALNLQDFEDRPATKQHLCDWH